MARPRERVASAIAKAQAELEQALSELERMPALDPGSVAFAAHVLNNYLTVTGGTIELALKRLGEHPDAQLRTWLDGARHATSLMSRIVGQLMMNAGAVAEIAARFEKVDLPGVVRRVCGYYRDVAARKTIRVTVASAADVPPVRADRVLVAAVLDNLLSNAVKYSPPGTHIAVQVRGEPGGAVCSVKDEGPGLSRDDQARLFQRGVQLAPRPTGGESSTGYGLAVAKELVEKLGGAIWCESTLGEGATFAFRLRAFEERGQAPTS